MQNLQQLGIRDLLNYFSEIDSESPEGEKLRRLLYSEIESRSVGKSESENSGGWHEMSELPPAGEIVLVQEEGNGLVELCEFNREEGRWLNFNDEQGLIYRGMSVNDRNFRWHYLPEPWKFDDVQ